MIESEQQSTLKKLGLDKETLEGCIHCGLCLPACPTYLATGRETESPRGRIYLVEQFSTGKLPFTKRMAEHLDSCLGCLGCQTACPSGVQYEEILDSVRPKLAEHRSPFARGVSRFAFKYLLPKYGLLKVLGALMRFWQICFGRHSLKNLVIEAAPNTTLSLPRRILHRLSQWEQFTPEVKEHVPLPPMVTPKNKSEKGQHTLLFSGCVMDIFYNHVNHSAMRLLLKQGHSVAVPEQTCCGALAFHQGEDDIARQLAKANIAKFGFGQDPIIVTAAGCGAMLKHYKELFKDDAEFSHKANQFSARVKDLSEQLAEFDFPEQANPLEEKTTYHAACHLAHAQDVRKEPEKLLKGLCGSTDDESNLTTLPEAEHCCGSAGIYNLFNTDLSLNVLDRKMDCLEETGAETVVTSNPGCQLQLEAGIRSRGLPIKVKHLAEALDQAYKSEPADKNLS